MASMMQLKHIKFLWISIFFLWLIITFLIIIYLELFHGINGPITKISTSYNINTRDKQIADIINNFNKDNGFILPSQLQKMEHVVVLMYDVKNSL